MDGWPPVKVKRFKNECPKSYASRSEQIRQIVDGFRHGKFSGRQADEMDSRLEQLSAWKNATTEAHFG